LTAFLSVTYSKPARQLDTGKLFKGSRCSETNGDSDEQKESTTGLEKPLEDLERLLHGVIALGARDLIGKLDRPHKLKRCLMKSKR
jgi:hypothetical protein